MGLETMSVGFWVVVGLMVLCVALLGSFLASLYRKAGPHEALIVYGFRGTRIVKGHGTVIFPMIESSHHLSLELMSFDVAPVQDLYTKQGVAVTVEAVAQIKVKSDVESIQTASEQFLTKTPDQRESLIRLVMEGHLRGIIGQLTVEQIVKEPEMVGDKVRNTCAGEFAKMGLEMISFTIKEVRDQNQYIENMGLPEIERIKKEANIAAAEAQRDTEIKRAQASRDSAVAKAVAAEHRVIAEAASLAKQAEAERDLEIKKAQYVEIVQRQRAQADKSYEIQAAVMQQALVAEQVRTELVEKAEQVKVQEAEIARAENELTATQLTTAQIEAKKIVALAEAEKMRHELQAEAIAEAIRKKGEAEADAIRKRGEAKAAVMELRAAAYRGYTEAAMLDRLLSSMPEIARVIAAPLGKIDKVTVVSTDGSSGASKLSGEVAKVAAQVPALVESLAGVSLQSLFAGLNKPNASAAPRPSANGLTVRRPEPAAAPRTEPQRKTEGC